MISHCDVTAISTKHYLDNLSLLINVCFNRLDKDMFYVVSSLKDLPFDDTKFSPRLSTLLGTT